MEKGLFQEKKQAFYTVIPSFTKSNLRWDINELEEKIPILSSHSMQRFLCSVGDHDLAVCLYTLSPKVRKQILNHIGKKRVELIMDEMMHLLPISENNIKKSITEVLSTLETLYKSRTIYDYNPLKGIFWFTCSFDSDGCCDFTDSQIISQKIPCNLNGEPLYKQNFNSQNQSTFTHKHTWDSLVSRNRDLRRYPWNYFPRGRVEIRNQKALLFMNPNILECPDFKERIISIFDLSGIPLTVIPDNSKHYNCYADSTIYK